MFLLGLVVGGVLVLLFGMAILSPLADVSLGSPAAFVAAPGVLLAAASFAFSIYSKRIEKTYELGEEMRALLTGAPTDFEVVQPAEAYQNMKALGKTRNEVLHEKRKIYLNANLIRKCIWYLERRVVDRAIFKRDFASLVDIAIDDLHNLEDNHNKWIDGLCGQPSYAHPDYKDLVSSFKPITPVSQKLRDDFQRAVGS